MVVYAFASSVHFFGANIFSGMILYMYFPVCFLAATPCVSYTSVAQTGVEPTDLFLPPQLNPCEGAAAYPKEPSGELCPFSSSDGVCPYAEQCLYTHPTLCEYCDRYMLHPSDEKQRNEHTEVSGVN